MPDVYFYLLFTRTLVVCIRINKIWNITAYEPFYLTDMSMQSLENISGHNYNSSFLEFWKRSQKRKLVLTAHWMHSLNFFFKFTVATTADYEENGKLFSIRKTNQAWKLRETKPLSLKKNVTSLILPWKCRMQYDRLIKGRGRGKQMWTGFSQYVTRAYLSHSLNGTKA